MKTVLLVGAVFLALGFSYQSAAIHAEEKKTSENKPLNQVTNIPDHEVQYEDSLSPEWKKNWDLARELYRDKKYREALVQYEILLTQKENCDEARWEYVTLLIRQKRWQQAGEQLEKLIANDPDNSDYAFAMAEVNLNSGKIDTSIEEYRKLLASGTEPPANSRALEGLIKALEMKGDLQGVTFYLEKLIALKPDKIELKIKLAQLHLESGQLEKARDLLTKLEESTPENPAVLKLQAKLQNKLGEKDIEALYRQKLISIDPDDFESHAMLQEYYREKNNWSMSLKHLEVLLKNKPNDVDLLESAADLNLKLDRIDRALEYYDYILAQHPNNKSVIKKKKDAQKALAEDLVVLVEHDGGQKLWQDLVKVTADRSGVYREIANLLRIKGYTDELIEVLTLICLEDPSDEKTLAELTDLMKKTGRDDKLKVLQAKLIKIRQENN